MRVTEAIQPAIEHTKRVLFPFAFDRWLAFGLVFFLQSCVEGSGGINFPGGTGGGGGSGGDSGLDGTDNASPAATTTNSILPALQGLSRMASGADDVPAWISSPSTWIGVGIAIALVVIPLTILALWLGARGRVMAVHAVANGHAPFNELWSQAADIGGRVFRFELLLFGVVGLVFVPLFGIGIWMMFSTFKEHKDLSSLIAFVSVIVLVGFVVGLPALFFASLFRNFVIPIMIRTRVGVREGFSRVFSMLQANWGQLFVFFLLRVVFSFGAAIVGTIASLLTCCIGFLPVLHQTLMAPYLVFERAHSLFILASVSEEYNLFAPAPGGMAPPPPPPGFGPPPGAFGPPGGGDSPPGGYGPPR